MFIGRPRVEPPPEVVKFLKQAGLSPKDFPWYDVPSLNPPRTRLSLEQVNANPVDLLPMLDKYGLLGHKILTRSLRTLDTLVGCGHHCDTCLANAAFPSAIFSFPGLVDAFTDRRFLRTLNPQGIRFGSAGDVLDHPFGREIIELALESTEELDQAEFKRSEGRNRYKIKVYTNFRPHLKNQLTRLIDLALANLDRLKLVISLPMNRVDTINDLWVYYATKKPHIFVRNKLDGNFSSLVENIGVQDVRLRTGAWMVGRVLDKKYRDRIGREMFHDGERDLNYRQRGLVKTYLNPDSLWLMIYATMREASSVRVFTPLNSDNIDLFSQLPWHEDFHTPPNWIGGRGQEYTSLDARDLMKKAAYKRSKPVTIVK